MTIALHIMIGVVVICLLLLIAMTLFAKFDKGSNLLRKKYGENYQVERIIRPNLRYSYYISSNTVAETIDNHFVLSVISSGELVFECNLKNTTENEVKHAMKNMIAEFEELGVSPAAFKKVSY